MSGSGDVVIVSATRTAIGRFEGSLRSVAAVRLGSAVIADALRGAGIDAGVVDEVHMGNVLQAGVGQAPARQASLHAGLPASVPATTINKVCGSGLKAVMLGASMIRASDAQVIVAGGMESMNGAPYLLPEARFGHRMGDAKAVDAMVHDGLWCSFENQHMGSAAEWIAREHDITRKDMDAYSLASHQKAVMAIDSGAFAREIVPIDVSQRRGASVSFAADECPRRGTSLESLSALRPAFLEGGCVTAGNASSVADGAAALTIMRRDTAHDLGCVPLARIVAYGGAAVPPKEIFTAPAHAIPRVLAKAEMSLADVDLLELNEAFAAQVLANGRALGVDWARVTVNGGAIALGHPIGASGARILVTLIHALMRNQVEVGLAALCLGGGEAVALIVEIESA